MTGFGPLGSFPLGGSGGSFANTYLNEITDSCNATDQAEAVFGKLMASSGTASDGITSSLAKVLADSANATDAINTLLAMAIHDRALATGLLTSTGNFLSTLVNNAFANDTLRAALLGIISDEADATESLSAILTHYGVLRDLVLATDTTQTSLTASNLLFGAALATDLPGWAYSAQLSDQAGALDTLVSSILAVGELLDTASAQSTLSNSLTVFGFLEDVAQATESLTSAATLLGLLASSASAAVVLRFGADEYTAWVLNTENIAVTQYTNYNFNAYTDYEGRYYGSSEDGVYRLAGDDDAGEAIQAYFRAPLTDFGFASLKRAPEFYIGYTADGDLLLKAIVVSPNGYKEEHWYRLEPRPAGGLRETRKQPGKGLKSVYWQYEIHNIDGADFQIDTVRMWPMGLTRRVR